MAQPNIKELAGGPRTIMREVERFENVPALGGVEAINARLDQLLQQRQQLLDTINQDHQAMFQHLESINSQLDLLPMRIYNRSLGDDSVLEGRDGRIPHRLPNTLNALRAANLNRCNALARHLNIEFERRMTLNERRQEIAKFLGVHL